MTVLELAHYKIVKPTLNVKPINEIDMTTINAIITIGGDGTILWANKYFNNSRIPPIIAFAMGTVNYMCNFSVKDYANVLTRGLNLDSRKATASPFQLEVKSRIECTVSLLKCI